MRSHRRRHQGQSLVELAILTPVLLLLVFGITDFARAFGYSVEIGGAVRAGAREAITSDTADIGDAVRSEPNTAIPDSTAAWGSNGPGAAYANCTAAPTSQSCGDPNGCPTSAFTSTPGRVACFAIRTCALSNTDYGTCTTYGAWGSRPVTGSPNVHGVYVLVVYRYTPLNPLVPALPASFSGILELKQSVTADELYF